MKNDENIQKIGFIFILIVIFLSSIFIGSNVKNPIWIVQFLVSAFSIFFIVFNKIKHKKNIIIKNNIDIIVLFL